MRLSLESLINRYQTLPLLYMSRWKLKLDSHLPSKIKKKIERNKRQRDGCYNWYIDLLWALHITIGHVLLAADHQFIWLPGEKSKNNIWKYKKDKKKCQPPPPKPFNFADASNLCMWKEWQECQDWYIRPNPTRNTQFSLASDKWNRYDGEMMNKERIYSS